VATGTRGLDYGDGDDDGTLGGVRELVRTA
jgi:hypothetical protein